MGSFRKFSRIHLPRSTGDVRVAYDDTVSTLACVRTPPRGVPVRSTFRKSVPFYTRNAVKRSQFLVHEGVLRVDHVEDAPVVADEVLEEHLRLLPHRHAEVIVELGELLSIGRDRFQPAEFQPLPGEVLDQSLGFRILEHPLDLGGEYRRFT